MSPPRDRPEPDNVRRRNYIVAGQTVEAKPLAAGLHVVATPIGNLGDITLRALETLAAADLIACEDSRVTRKLCERYGLTTPLTPYHDHNAETARPRILQRHFLDVGIWRPGHNRLRIHFNTDRSWRRHIILCCCPGRLLARWHGSFWTWGAPGYPGF